MMCVLVLISVTISTVLAASPPPYIKSCALEKLVFEPCALKSANEAVPHIVKGDRKRHILPMNPLFLPLVEVTQNNLILNFKNLSMYGAENLKVTDIKLNKSNLKFTLTNKNLTFVGQYELDGSLNFLNLKGSGAVVVKAIDGSYTFDGTLETYSKKEDTYVKYNKPLMTYTVGKVYFQFDNLLGVEGSSGIQPNQILNDNWDQVLEEIDTPLKEAVTTVLQSIVNSILDDIPEKNIFPN